VKLTKKFLTRISFVIFLIIAVTAIALFLWQKAKTPVFYAAPKQDDSEIFQKRDIEYPFVFIAYGDSREPSGYEKEALIAQVIKENPSFVLFLGDMVLWSEEHHWNIFDLFDGKIINAGIPFYPILGNHDYYTRKESHPPNPEKQLQHYFERFKFLENRRWYSFVYGNSSFLMLDTNTNYSPASYQYKWLVNKIKEETADFIFVATHHPPYTKSASQRRSEKLLAHLFESYSDKGLRRVDIVFSGHIHNYERYRYNDINYIVAGGGGAPQYTVRRDPDDFYTEPGETFHYCKLTVSETKIFCEMIKLETETGKWIIRDSFTIAK